MTSGHMTSYDMSFSAFSNYRIIKDSGPKKEKIKYNTTVPRLQNYLPKKSIISELLILESNME